MSIIEAITSYGSKVMDLIFPFSCGVCSKNIDRGPALCSDCWNKIKFISSNSCCICSAPFSEIDYHYDNLVCGACIKKKPYYDKARYVMEYGDVGKVLISRLKFCDDTSFIDVIARMMVNYSDDFIDISDIIIPVPLHFFRRLGRKYNQSALICTAMKKINTKIIIRNDILFRKKYTRPQSRLSYNSRVANIRNVFDVTNEEDIKGKSILLVDDVVTTSSTVNACSYILKRFGAKEVRVMSLCKNII